MNIFRMFKYAHQRATMVAPFVAVPARSATTGRSTISLRQFGLNFEKTVPEFYAKDLKNIDKKQQVQVREQYRNGFTHEEVKDQSEAVQRVLRLENASPSEILALKRKKAIEKYQNSPFDTGSLPVRIVAMTEKIYSLVVHCQNNRKDTISHRGLCQLLDNRRRALWYLRLQNYHLYRAIITEYNIPDTPPKYHHHTTNFRGPKYTIHVAASGRQKKYDISHLFTKKQLLRKANGTKF